MLSCFVLVVTDVAEYLCRGEYHGAGGEWRVEQQQSMGMWGILEAFSQAAQEAGIPSTADFNTGSNEGVSYFEVNQKSGVRWNTAKAFLRPARKTLHVCVGAQVTRVLVANRDSTTVLSLNGFLHRTGLSCAC